MYLLTRAPEIPPVRLRQANLSSHLLGLIAVPAPSNDRHVVSGKHLNLWAETCSYEQNEIPLNPPVMVDSRVPFRGGSEI